MEYRMHEVRIANEWSNWKQMERNGTLLSDMIGAYIISDE